ncbi:hypothetical protein NSTC745_05187 [Nostoc sp. DSM 114161]|jgi:hypothetical protein
MIKILKACPVTFSLTKIKIQNGISAYKVNNIISVNLVSNPGSNLLLPTLKYFTQWSR